MHAIQHNVENDRNNPSIGNMPGLYMHGSVQYFPTSSEARSDVHGHNPYHDTNRLMAPNEYRRPSSAPLTPVEPKKIGRRIRRSNSVEELSPDSLDNGLSRYQFPTGLSVRTCGGLNIPDPHKTISASHFAAMGSSIMSHTQPISFDRRHEYEMHISKTDKVSSTDLKEINHRPYIDSRHPYSNIKKNLAERFIMTEGSEHAFFKPTSTSLTSSTFHPDVSRPSENYFNYGQFPQRTVDSNYSSNLPSSQSGTSRGPYTGSHETMGTRPYHSEQLSVRTNHIDIHPRPAGHSNEAPPNRSILQKDRDDAARVQAMNTYLEMMANVQSPANAHDGLFIRSREVIIQKGNYNQPPSTYNSSSSHQITNSHHSYTHPHDIPGKTMSTDKALPRLHELNATQHPHEKSLTKHPHEQNSTRHPHEQNFTRHPHGQNLTRHPHEQNADNHPFEQSVVRHPDLNHAATHHIQKSVIQQHHLHDNGVPMQHGTPPHPGMESTMGGGLTTNSTHNAPWSTVGPGDIHEKEQNVNLFRPPLTNSMECGCTYSKNDVTDCKGRNHHLKAGETDHVDHSRYIKPGEMDHADHSRYMRNTDPPHEVPKPYEGPQYRQPDKSHPPELISFQEKAHSVDYNALSTPSRPCEMAAPPVLKIETPRTDSANSPSSHKKRPRPEPLIIPSTVNNKVLLSTPCSMGRPVMNLQHGSVYTPPPMLSPRSVFFNPPLSIPRVYPPGTGYVVQTPRRVSLIDSKLETPTSAVSSTDKPVEVPEPKINVGPQFQAVVPNIYEKSEAQKDIHRAGLMWSPLKDEKRKDEEVLEYLEMACSLALYGGSTNKEYALHILQRTRGNVKEAIRLLLSRRHILRADDPNADYHYSGSVRWNAKERLAFRTAFHTKGKIFPLIQKGIGSKSVAQCVEFYYLWKARHPESFRMRTRTAAVEVESEQDEEEVPPTPTAAVAPLSTLREPVFECDYPDCNARFISRQALNGHIRVHGGSHTKTPESRRPPKEKGSNSNSPKTGQVGLNADGTPKRKKVSIPGTPAHASDGTPIQFQCKVCGRVFNKVKSRSAHMKTHVKRDENNKPIKTQKTKVQVEIKPLQKPFDNLIHAFTNDSNNNDVTFETAKPSPAFDQILDNSKQPFNFSVDMTNPRFAPIVDNLKPPFGVETTNAQLGGCIDQKNPPHVSSSDNVTPLDTTAVQIKPQSDISVEHLKSFESSETLEKRVS